MKKTCIRLLAFVLTLALLVGSVSLTFVVNAKESVTIAETGVTNRVYRLQ